MTSSLGGPASVGPHCGSGIAIRELPRLRCAVMQPTFLPWAGYFRLMAEVDHFVFLDDVQLARQSWQTRNRVLVGGNVRWIVVPIRHGGLEQMIADTAIIDDGLWRRKLGRLLRQTYARQPHAADLETLIAFLESSTHVRVGELNIALIEYCANRLGVSPLLHRSNEFSPDIAMQRTERLVEICRKLGCDAYLSPPGSADYLEADGFTGLGAINLEFARYTPPPYAQRGVSTFVSHLSIVDVVANLGWRGAAEYVRAPWPAAEQAE
jgi:hypothetical protein